MKGEIFKKFSGDFFTFGFRSIAGLFGVLMPPTPGAFFFVRSLFVAFHLEFKRPVESFQKLQKTASNGMKNGVK